MTWTALNFPFASLLSSTKMTQLFDNFAALAAKDAGAPVLANAYVNQAILKTTTASGTTSVGASAGASVGLTGGTFSWWTGGADESAGMSFGNGDVAAGTIGVHNHEGAGPRTFYRDERYVQASPPYRLGPCFVFLAIEPGGQIRHLEVAPDPIWAYHGPTDIVPDFARDGKFFKRRILVDGVPLKNAFRDPAIVQRIINDIAVVTEDEVEIDLAYKDSDMPLLPHPWAIPGGANIVGSTVVLLEPGTKLMQVFADMCDAGEAREVSEIVKTDRLNIANVDLKVPNAPPGVTTVRAVWRMTP